MRRWSSGPLRFVKVALGDGALEGRGADAMAAVRRYGFQPVSHPFLAALAPVAHALGAVLVDADDVAATDIPLEWEGRLVGGLRLPNLEGALQRLIEQVERDLGAPLSELSREDKQRAVKLLDERGAFVLRRAVEDVADAFGVSRITVYNYLNAIRS